MTGIYKITNQLTQEVYIGQSKNIERRIAQHKVASKKLNETALLYRKIREYGIENFSFDVIEECNVDKLDEREIYWISYYNSYEKRYNMNILEMRKEKEIIKKIIYELKNNYKIKYKEISPKIKLSLSTISRLANEK